MVELSNLIELPVIMRSSPSIWATSEPSHWEASIEKGEKKRKFKLIDDIKLSLVTIQRVSIWIVDNIAWSTGSSINFDFLNYLD